VPKPLARTITGRVLQSLRGYFFGVTIVAASNAVVVGLGALILGVPLAGTIAGGALFGAAGLILAAPLTSAATRISADLAKARAAQPANRRAPRLRQPRTPRTRDAVPAPT
jgi:predicted PurR-regulated permease PerM